MVPKTEIRWANKIDYAYLLLIEKIFSEVDIKKVKITIGSRVRRGNIEIKRSHFSYERTVTEFSLVLFVPRNMINIIIDYKNQHSMMRCLITSRTRFIHAFIINNVANDFSLNLPLHLILLFLNAGKLVPIGSCWFRFVNFTRKLTKILKPRLSCNWFSIEVLLFSASLPITALFRWANFLCHQVFEVSWESHNYGHHASCDEKK